MSVRGKNPTLGVIPTVRTYIYESLLYSTLLACNSCPTLFIVTLDLCRVLSGTAQGLTCGGVLQVGMSLLTQRLVGERVGRWNEVGEWGICAIILTGWCHNSTLHIFDVGRYVGWGLYTELFYAIIPTLFLCFLLICYPYILLHF